MINSLDIGSCASIERLATTRELFGLGGEGGLGGKGGGGVSLLDEIVLTVCWCESLIFKLLCCQMK